MDKQKVLNRLVSDLQSFLLVLDKENLSYIAQAQKKSISDLLTKLQDPPVEDAEYMIMNCPSGATSSDLRENQSSDTGDVFHSVLDLNLTEDSSCAEWLLKGNQGPSLPPYPPDGLDEDCYEEAEPFILSTDVADSDSSHYESYGEEEDFVKDRAHYIQWSASQPCLRAPPESRICGYLWRKKWLGQWTKQLFLIRSNVLLCYKCAKDLTPLLELNLQGCQAVYKSKHGKKMQHELKVVSGSDTVIMGFQSCQQAEEWRMIIEEASGMSHYDKETHTSSSLVKCEKHDSCRSSTVLHTDSEEERSSGLHTAVSSLEVRDKGYLNVLMNCQWQSLWCQADGGTLKMFRDEEGEAEPQYSVQLRGCEVRPGPDTPQAYRITVAQHGDQVAVLEVACADEKERWIQLLQDGSSVSGDSSHEHLETLRQDMQLEEQPFSGLLTRRFPTSNMYIDDPFHQLSPTSPTQPIYSNTPIVEHMFHQSQSVNKRDSRITKHSTTFNNSPFLTNHKAKPSQDLERKVQKLDLASNKRVHLRAGSEINLATAGKPVKRSSFRQSLAFCADKAQGGFLTPLLRRTASAKNTLRRAPSVLFIEKGKVFQKKKEWESKTST